MGCGSLSTTAFPPSYGSLGDNKSHNFPRSKDKSDPIANNEHQIHQSTKLSPGYPLLGPTQQKSESKSEMVRNTNVPANGNHQKSSGQTGFTMSMKEIDEDKHRYDDDGGIWLGTDTNEDEQILDKTASVMAQVSRNEDFSFPNRVKQEGAIFSDVDTTGINAMYTTNLATGQCSKPSTTTEPNVINTERTIKPLSATTSFMRRSQKHRHLQDNRVHYDSVEEPFSNSFGHFDDDKQMSDSELDDYVSSGLATSETEMNFIENKHDCGHHGDDVPFTDLDDLDGGRSIIPSRLPEDQNTDICNIDTDYSLTGVASKDHGAYSPSKTRDTMFETFNKQMSLESFNVFPDIPLLPHFMVKCVRYIEAEGLKTEGLYRISGSRSLGDQFLNKYAADPNVDIAASEIPVHVIATLLKSFVNNLEEALIPSNLYYELVNAMDVTNRSSQLAIQRDAVKKLAAQQFAVLKYIIDHLHKVAQYQEFNSMNSRNLAKCWWPTLIRLQFSTYDNLVQGSQVPEQIVQILIEQCQFIFHDGDEV